MFDFYMDAHMHFDLYDDRSEILVNGRIRVPFYSLQVMP